MTIQNGPVSGHALLIGIDRYWNAPPLRGSKNDIQLMASVLGRFGFAPDNIRRLIDEAATRQAILSELDSLLHAAGGGEFLFIHFSGWGLRVPREAAGPDQIITPWGPSTRDAYPIQKGWLPPSKYPRGSTAPGDTPLGEMTSALVPHDWDRTSESAIPYDELHAWLARAVDHDLILVIDAPYAGGLSEGGQAISDRHVLMGASRHEEICMEFQAASGVFQGAFTYYLAQALMEAEPGATYRDLFYRVSAQVAARFQYQHPQLAGNADAPLFTAGQSASTRLVAVKRRERDRVTLTAGAAYGATVRSKWTIYRAAESDITSSTPKLGQVEIIGVQATQAEAQVLSESGRDVIRPGAVAVEEAHFYGEMRLTVRIEAPPEHQWERDGLAKLLLGSELLRLVEGEAGPDASDIIVHLLPQRSGTAETDRVPQLEELSEPTWAAVDRSSTLVMAPVSAIGSAAPYEVRDKLENLARYRNVLGLRNPNPNSTLAGRIHVTLMRQESNGGWIPAEADLQSGMPVFQQGDRIGLEIANHHSEPIYVGVLDFGLASSLSMLHPTEGPTAQIPPGEKMQLGMQPGKELEVYLPDDLHREAGWEDEGEASGIETLKLFATVYPTDLGRLLLQQGGRGMFSSQGEGTALWQLLDTALTGVGSREPRPVQLPPDQDWFTVDRAFELRRKR